MHQPAEEAVHRDLGDLVALAGQPQHPGHRRLVQRVERLAGGGEQAFGGGLLAEQVQGADLAGRAAEAAVQLAVDERAGAGAQSGHHEHHVAHPDGRALPVFGDGRQVGVVLDQYRAAERASQPGPEVEARPAGHRGAELYGALAVDDAGAADADRPQVVPRDPGLAQHLGHGGPDGGEPLLGVQRLVHGLEVTAEHLSRQVGEDHPDVVHADLDAEDVPCLGPEAEPAGRTAALTAAAGLPGAQRGLDLGDEPGLDQTLDHAFHGGPGEPGVTDQLSEGHRLAGSQCAQRDRGVDPPQQRGVSSGEPIRQDAALPQSRDSSGARCRVRVRGGR